MIFFFFKALVRVASYCPHSRLDINCLLPLCLLADLLTSCQDLTVHRNVEVKTQNSALLPPSMTQVLRRHWSFPGTQGHAFCTLWHLGRLWWFFLSDNCGSWSCCLIGAVRVTSALVLTGFSAVHIYIGYIMVSSDHVCYLALKITAEITVHRDISELQWGSPLILDTVDCGQNHTGLVTPCLSSSVHQHESQHGSHRLLSQWLAESSAQQ